ncbi:hypothetical protein CBL_06191 [Carabus blaptoides fortunei]
MAHSQSMFRNVTGRHLYFDQSIKTSPGLTSFIDISLCNNSTARTVYQTSERVGTRLLDTSTACRESNADRQIFRPTFFKLVAVDGTGVQVRVGALSSRHIAQWPRETSYHRGTGTRYVVSLQTTCRHNAPTATPKHRIEDRKSLRQNELLIRQLQHKALVTCRRRCALGCRLYLAIGATCSQRTTNVALCKYREEKICHALCCLASDRQIRERVCVLY